MVLILAQLCAHFRTLIKHEEMVLNSPDKSVQGTSLSEEQVWYEFRVNCQTGEKQKAFIQVEDKDSQVPIHQSTQVELDCNTPGVGPKMKTVTSSSLRGPSTTP